MVAKTTSWVYRSTELCLIFFFHVEFLYQGGTSVMVPHCLLFLYLVLPCSHLYRCPLCILLCLVILKKNICSDCLLILSLIFCVNGNCLSSVEQSQKVEVWDSVKPSSVSLLVSFTCCHVLCNLCCHLGR